MTSVVLVLNVFHYIIIIIISQVLTYLLLTLAGMAPGVGVTPDLIICNIENNLLL